MICKSRENGKTYNVLNEVKLVSFTTHDKTRVMWHQNVYDYLEDEWGWELISWKELINPKHGFIEDNKFDIEVKIKFSIMFNYVIIIMK